MSQVSGASDIARNWPWTISRPMSHQLFHRNSVTVRFYSTLAGRAAGRESLRRPTSRHARHSSRQLPDKSGNCLESCLEILESAGRDANLPSFTKRYEVSLTSHQQAGIPAAAARAFLSNLRWSFFEYGKSGKVEAFGYSELAKRQFLYSPIPPFSNKVYSLTSYKTLCQRLHSDKRFS